MSISIHIPFYNPNPQKKEGYRQLTRFDFLKENIENLKNLSINNEIFIHTHNDYLDNKNLNAKIINHKINEIDLEKLMDILPQKILIAKSFKVQKLLLVVQQFDFFLHSAELKQLLKSFETHIEAINY